MHSNPDGPSADYAERLATEARRWADLGHQKQQRTSWLHSPLVLRHVNSMISGHPDRSWPEAVVAHFLPRERWGGPGLSLGCNEAAFERAIMSFGVCSSFDGYDISPPAVADAQAAADRDGLPMRFHVADANTIALPPDHYALAVIIMALHHVERLEHVCSEIHQALRPDGLFAFDEFVGPTRFQWTAAQVEAANSLRARLPSRLRRLRSGADAGDVTVPDLEMMRRSDPFEAIRSAEILPIVRNNFRVLAQCDYGGSALHLALHEIIGNFDEANPEHADLLQQLCDQERAWLAAGDLPSDFTVLVACRRDAPVARFGASRQAQP